MKGNPLLAEVSHLAPKNKEDRNMENVWWKEPMRVLQYNLQVRDTPGMDAEKIARETEEMAANVVVMNVGGIYAWYQSKVKYHHINEFLPEGRDLLREWIAAFHKRNIKFVARFDFSITDDTTYQQKPQWFARHKDKSPYYRGEKRMGNWSLFLNTCATGGYRNEEVGVPVIREVLENYDIDGIFFNAPFASACFCERCQEKYLQKYGKEMPDSPDDFEPDWLSYCTKENIGVIYRAIKEVRAEVPMILYYCPFTSKSKAFGRFDRDNIYDRYATADLICTESQNVLSNGINEIPETIHPVLSMKAGQTEDGELLPFGIIHSCPGMDWRHVGLPENEYLPWMCQVPAANATIWHSVTGYNDTITDKRIIHTITTVDKMIMKCEQDMHGVKSKADVLLYWNGSQAGRNWADILMKEHIQFDFMHDYCINRDRLMKYKAAILPDGFPVTEGMDKLLEAYVSNGGNLLAERCNPDEIVQMAELYGVEKSVQKGEYLYASYMRFEENGVFIKEGMDTDKAAFRGEVNYCIPTVETDVCMTLVPPFAPMEVVGAPPERASIPTPFTDIPLAMLRACGKGKVLLLPFRYHMLTASFHLKDHYHMAYNMIKQLTGDNMVLKTDMPSSVQVTMYEKKNKLLIHLVNETGQRPLMDMIPVYSIRCSVALPGNKQIASVRSVIGEEKITYKEMSGRVEILLDKLEVWDMISVDLK